MNVEAGEGLEDLKVDKARGGLEPSPRSADQRDRYQWGYCESLTSTQYPPCLTDSWYSRAVGTPLDWPEAKKVASHVRSWGIEVQHISKLPSHILTFNIATT